MGRRQRARDRTTLPDDLFDLELVEAFTDKGDALIKIASPGWGTTGYYGADMLKRDAPTAFPVGTHMYLDHPGETEKMDMNGTRKIRDLAATLTEAGHWLDKGPKGEGVYARVNALSPHRDLIEALAPHIGLSLRAPGMVESGEAEGRRGPIVKAMGVAHSVDFVTKAGRGGEIAQLLESAGLEWPTLEENDDDELEESGNVGVWFESRIHNEFTNYAESMYGDGRLIRDERVALSSAIGDALDAFTAAVTAKAPQLFDRDRWTEPGDMVVDLPTTQQEAAMPLTPEDLAAIGKQNAADLVEALKPIQAELAEAKTESAEAKATSAQLVEALNQTTARDHVRGITDKAIADGFPKAAAARALATATTTVPLTEAGAVDLAALTESAQTALKAEVAYLEENGANFGSVITGLGATETGELNEADIDAELVKSFQNLGLSETAAKTAAGV